MLLSLCETLTYFEQNIQNSERRFGATLRHYPVKKCKEQYEYIIFETIHKIFSGAMGRIPKVRNTIRKMEKTHESVT